MLVLNLIPSHAVVKTSLFGETGFHEKLERSINCRIADPGVVLANLLIEVLTRHVATRFEKRFEDHLALLRLLEIVALKILRKRFLFGFMRHRGDFSRPSAIGYRPTRQAPIVLNNPGAEPVNSV